METEFNKKICRSCKYFRPFDGQESEGACEADHHTTRDYFKCSNLHYEHKDPAMRIAPARPLAKKSMVGGLGRRLALAAIRHGLQTKK